MVTVVNLRTHAHTVYIGRAGHGQAGTFGNPFIVGRHGQRGECCALFATWFHSDAPAAVAMRAAALRIPEDAVLGCFCKPAACHGDTIAEYVNHVRARMESSQDARTDVGLDNIS